MATADTSGIRVWVSEQQPEVTVDVPEAVVRKKRVTIELDDRFPNLSVFACTEVNGVIDVALMHEESDGPREAEEAPATVVLTFPMGLTAPCRFLLHFDGDWKCNPVEVVNVDADEQTLHVETATSWSLPRGPKAPVPVKAVEPPQRPTSTSSAAAAAAAPQDSLGFLADVALDPRTVFSDERAKQFPFCNECKAAHLVETCRRPNCKLAACDLCSVQHLFPRGHKSCFQGNGVELAACKHCQLVYEVGTDPNGHRPNYVVHPKVNGCRHSGRRHSGHRKKTWSRLVSRAVLGHPWDPTKENGNIPERLAECDRFGAHGGPDDETSSVVGGVIPSGAPSPPPESAPRGRRGLLRSGQSPASGAESPPLPQGRSPRKRGRQSMEEPEGMSDEPSAKKPRTPGTPGTPGGMSLYSMSSGERRGKYEKRVSQLRRFWLHPRVSAHTLQEMVPLLERDQADDAQRLQQLIGWFAATRGNGNPSVRDLVALEIAPETATDLPKECSWQTLARIRQYAERTLTPATPSVVGSPQQGTLGRGMSADQPFSHAASSPFRSPGGAGTGEPRSNWSTMTIHCPECSKVLATQHSLERHLRSHTGEKPFGCKFCSRQWIDPTSVKSHVCPGNAAFNASLPGAEFCPDPQCRLVFINATRQYMLHEHVSGIVRGGKPRNRTAAAAAAAIASAIASNVSVSVSQQQGHHGDMELTDVQ